MWPLFLILGFVAPQKSAFNSNLTGQMHPCHPTTSIKALQTGH